MKRVFILLLVFFIDIFAEEFEKAKKLLKAYPETILGYEDNKIIFKDGSSLIFDDKLDKSYKQRLEYADIEDHFFDTYPKEESFVIKEFCDAGRYRNIEFFKKIYGTTKKEVEKNLVFVKWLPKTLKRRLRVTKINGVDKRVEMISKELDNLPKEYKKYLKNTSAFLWRKISGTQRLSTHSFGIAIDINIKYGNYWKWEDSLIYKNQIPMQIVKIFEKYGFIWGGKWYHYDTLHFEYRPELFISE